jgi:hypothetical protein
VDTWVLVANASAFAGRVRLTLLFEDGTQSAAVEKDVPANSRTTFWGGAAEFGAANKRFGVIVESLAAAGGTAQIVVERAMYSDANGIRWVAGTDATATKLR